MKKTIFLISCIFVFAVALESHGEVKKNVKKSDKMTFYAFIVSENAKCAKMEPIIDEVRRDYQEVVNFKIIDAFKERKYWDDYGLKEVPSFVILDTDGKEVCRHAGFWQKDQIVQILEEKGIKKTNMGPLKNVKVIGDKFYKGKSKVTFSGLPRGYLNITVFDSNRVEIAYVGNNQGEFVWDLKDREGNFVDVGEYRIVVKDGKDFIKELTVKVEIEKKKSVFDD